MWVTKLDPTTFGPETKGGILAVFGPAAPAAGEKRECVETVCRHALDGWVIAADPHTTIGRLAERAALAADATFLAIEQQGQSA